MSMLRLIGLLSNGLVRFRWGMGRGCEAASRFFFSTVGGRTAS